VEVLKADDVETSGIAAVGITNQRETTVVWDAITTEPLHNAIGNKICCY
jgi:glycerol kinase